MAAVLVGGVMRPMTQFAIREHVNKALARALTTGLYAHVREKGQVFVIPSTTRGGLAHVIDLQAQPPTCTCEAGEFLPYCVHRAAAQISEWLRAGYEVEVSPQGVVEVVMHRRAADVAYDISQYPALVDDTPPLPTEAPPEEEGEGGAAEEAPFPPPPAPMVRRPKRSVLDAD